jgi:hypothetical protein
MHKTSRTQPVRNDGFQPLPGLINAGCSHSSVAGLCEAGYRNAVKHRSLWEQTRPPSWRGIKAESGSLFFIPVLRRTLSNKATKIPRLSKGRRLPSTIAAKHRWK